MLNVNIIVFIILKNDLVSTMKAFLAFIGVILWHDLQDSFCWGNTGYPVCDQNG